MKHSSHESLVKRLRRAEGHLRSLINMMEDGRPCIELAQQLHAVENAIGNAKRELIHQHMDQCMQQAVSEGATTPNELLNEMRALSKYL